MRKSFIAKATIRFWLSLLQEGLEIDLLVVRLHGQRLYVLGQVAAFDLGHFDSPAPVGSGVSAKETNGKSSGSCQLSSFHIHCRETRM